MRATIMTLANLAAMLLATFLGAIGLVLLIPRPVHFITNAAARVALIVPLWAIVTVAAFGALLALRLHGNLIPE